MPSTNQLPVYELTRGDFVESTHYGSIAISDNQGRLVGWYGDPNTITFLRSSAKPFQAIPLLEAHGQEEFDLSTIDIALVCSSHSGTDEHVKHVLSLQSKTGIEEEELLCGVHPPLDSKTALEMKIRGEQLTPNRHNCSGKHTGMLTLAHMKNWSTIDYINPDHPLQKMILQTFSEMTGVQLGEIGVGIDGCSVPNFAVPLMNVAFAYARLCDPENFPPNRVAACKTIINAMTGNPFFVGGPDRFDTQIMKITSGRIVSKAGAEGFQAMGIMPGALAPDSPALGIAIKITDGDLRKRARPGVALGVLNQLNALSSQEKTELSSFGPTRKLNNYQELETGTARPAFKLNLIRF
jgi:L-asparaginase II